MEESKNSFDTVKDDKFNIIKDDTSAFLERVYDYNTDLYRCKTRVYTQNNSFKIRAQISIKFGGERKTIRKHYVSKWIRLQKKFDNTIWSILCFNEIPKQINSILFDLHYRSICSTWAGLIKRFKIDNPYKEYYINITDNQRFRKKFYPNEWREFWLILSDDFQFVIHNVSCKLPSTKLRYLHSFPACDIYQMNSIILRNEYPISNLYKWASNEIIEFAYPKLLKTLLENSNLLKDICKIILSYVFS